MLKPLPAFLKKQAVLWGVGLSLTTGTGIINSVPLYSQPHPSPTEPDMDNIYHEDENLPDDADVFPRMGHLVGETGDRNNCRVSPWGRVLRTVSSDSFVEIGDRTVDRTGESWFYATDMNCWIHDSRIDLL